MEENRPPINLHLPARILQNRQQKLNFCIKVVRLTNFLAENAINNKQVVKYLFFGIIVNSLAIPDLPENSRDTKYLPESSLILKIL